MSSFLHRGDDLEALNAQQHQQNSCLQEQVELQRQQVIQVQAPQLNPSPRVHQEIGDVGPEGVLGIHTWPKLPTKGTLGNSGPLVPTDPVHHTHQLSEEPPVAAQAVHWPGITKPRLLQ